VTGAMQVRADAQQYEGELYQESKEKFRSNVENVLPSPSERGNPVSQSYAWGKSVTPIRTVVHHSPRAIC
jgi:hypothetical protein